MGCQLWKERLEENLRTQAIPVVETSEIGTEVSTILSAANLWTRALQRVRQLRQAGIRRNDILCEASDSSELLVHLVASAIGGWIYWPLNRSDKSQFSANPPNRYQSERKIWMVETKSVRQVYRPNFSFSFLPDDTVLVLQTSGTTANPRIVGLTGKNLLHQLDSFNHKLPNLKDSSRLIVLPFHHCFGLIMDLLCSIFSKQTIFVRNHRVLNPESLIKTIAKNDIQQVSLVPRMLHLMLLHAERDSAARAILSKVQVHSGGAILTDSIIAQSQIVFGELVEGYGLTELAGGVLLRGRPNGCEVRLKKIEQSDCSELWVKSPSLGYFEGREDSMDSDGFFNTTDLARSRPDGTYQILGRATQMIKSTSGIWVQLSEVQSQIQKKFSLTHCYAENLGGKMRIYWADEKVAAVQLAEHIRISLGLSCELVDLKNAGPLQSLLAESQKKSSIETFRDWYEVQKCS